MRAVSLPAWLTGQRLVYAVLAGVLLFVAAQYLEKSSDNRSAFNRWRQQVKELVGGVDVYKKWIYPNAPMMGLILYPLAELPRVEVGSLTLDTGAFAWFFLKVLMTWLALRWCLRLCEEGGISFPPWAQGLTLLLALRPIMGDLTHGNVNLLILFLCVGTVYAFHQRRDGLAGLTLALAITCKVTPALFVPYFIWKRAWKTLAACGLGLLLFFAVVPGSILGFPHTLKITQSWFDKMIRPFAFDGEVTTEHHNQSVPGLVYRLLTPNPSFLDEDDKPVDYHNLANWSPATARLLVKVCGIAFLAALCWLCRAKTEPREQTRLAAEYAFVILGMLIFSERTWKHHCVTLLLPYAVICYQLATAQLSRFARWGYVGSLVLATLLMTTSSTSLWEALGDYKHGAKLAQVYGSYVWAYFVLLGAVVAILVQRDRVPQSAGGDGANLKATWKLNRRLPAPAPAS